MRKIILILLECVLAFSAFVGTVSAAPEPIGPCNGASRYAIFFGDHDGGSGQFIVCPSSNYSNLSAISNGNQTCNGTIGDNGTWNDCLSSVHVVGLTSSTKLCIFENFTYNGQNFKFTTSGYWDLAPFHSWTYIGGFPYLDDRLSSIKWCPA